MFFGRFQPFHKGHLEVSKIILKNYDEIVYAIGMSTESHTYRNPFTAGERIEMIRLALKEEGMDLSRVITVTIPTMEIHVSATSYIMHTSPRVDCITVGNPVVARIFKEAGYTVWSPKPIKREKYNGNLIRTLIIKNDPEWMNLVSRRVAEYLISINARERLVSVSSPEELHTIKDEKGV
jgi:nicotinamide-nucleotide adenylyltransferase